MNFIILAYSGSFRRFKKLQSFLRFKKKQTKKQNVKFMFDKHIINKYKDI